MINATPRRVGRQLGTQVDYTFVAKSYNNFTLKTRLRCEFRIEIAIRIFAQVLGVLIRRPCNMASENNLQNKQREQPMRCQNLLQICIREGVARFGVRFRRWKDYPFSSGSNTLTHRGELKCILTYLNIFANLYASVI